jgi:hypothetical protein
MFSIADNMVNKKKYIKEKREKHIVHFLLRRTAESHGKH